MFVTFIEGKETETDRKRERLSGYSIITMVIMHFSPTHDLV